MHERHILVKEYLREPMEAEEAAFARITSLAWRLPMAVLLTSALDLLMAYSYIMWLHPWRILLQVRSQQHRDCV